jgi:hypothetical protein
MASGLPWTGPSSCDWGPERSVRLLVRLAERWAVGKVRLQDIACGHIDGCRRPHTAVVDRQLANSGLEWSQSKMRERRRSMQVAGTVSHIPASISILDQSYAQIEGLLQGFLESLHTPPLLSRFLIGCHFSQPSPRLPDREESSSWKRRPGPMWEFFVHPHGKPPAESLFPSPTTQWQEESNKLGRLDSGLVSCSPHARASQDGENG